MSIGRKPYTRVGIPNNRYMPGRANVHLENYVLFPKAIALEQTFATV